MKKSLLMDVIEGKNLSFAQKNKLIIQLSLPTIFAQISTIIMEYIDASMVGRLGANDSASIGLVSSTIWLLTGLSSSFNAGFTVLMTHCIGADEKKEARNIMKQGFLVCLTLSVIVSIVSIVLSPILPVWLKGNVEIIKNASNYLKIYSFFIPFHCMNVMASFCLQASGNMKIPSIFNILMCLLNVILNYYFIFPAGLNMGVKGASLATGLSIIAFSCYFYLAIVQGATAMAYFLAILIGSLCGFLLYNKNKAKLFMGDTGSLALGGVIATVSIMLNQELTLIFIGFVFVVETLSVMMQVTSFKLTGKRIFKMSPLHHHFEMVGWSEWKIVTAFWIVGILTGIIGIYLGVN